jgi:serine/threonine-protein kinase
LSKSISPDTIIGHYRIVSKIGAGGMGEVYLAEDSRLHRKVALKILPSEMAANQDRMRRFKQEATAAAALNHSNIAHIYEIGESGGTNFIAMEFVAYPPTRSSDITASSPRSAKAVWVRFIWRRIRGSFAKWR